MMPPAVVGHRMSRRGDNSVKKRPRRNAGRRVVGLRRVARGCRRGPRTSMTGSEPRKETIWPRTKIRFKSRTSPPLGPLFSTKIHEKGGFHDNKTVDAAPGGRLHDDHDGWSAALAAAPVKPLPVLKEQGGRKEKSSLRCGGWRRRRDQCSEWTTPPQLPLCARALGR